MSICKATAQAQAQATHTLHRAHAGVIRDSGSGPSRHTMHEMHSKILNAFIRPPLPNLLCVCVCVCVCVCLWYVCVCLWYVCVCVCACVCRSCTPLQAPFSASRRMRHQPTTEPAQTGRFACFAHTVPPADSLESPRTSDDKSALPNNRLVVDGTVLPPSRAI